MATGFPVKANYATGDVLTAANMNDLAGTLNYLDPTAKGDLFPASDASTLTRLAVGANDTLLVADSTQTTGIKWQGTRTSFTPSWTNFTLGNGSLNYAEYIQHGKLVIFQVRVTLGTTSVVGNDPRLAVPVTGMSSSMSFYSKGNALDAGVAAYDLTIESYQDVAYMYVSNTYMQHLNKIS